VLDAVTVNFSNLLVFKAAVEMGSLNRAATVLGLTQPAVSRRIARLEDALGCQLVERSARGVTATEFGRAILTHVENAATELGAASKALSALRRAREGAVVCGGAPVSMSILVPAAHAFHKHRPTESLQLVEGSTPALIQMLKLGDLDLVVGSHIAHDEDDELEIEALVQEIPGVFVRADHALLERQPCDIAKLLSDEQWVLPAPDTHVRRFMQLELERRELNLPSKMIVASPHAALRWFVERTDYLVVSSSLVHLVGINEGKVARLETDLAFPPGQHVLYSRDKSGSSRAALRLMRCIRDVVANPSLDVLMP
jgi:LysR family pca operon transcriptional activator